MDFLFSQETQNENFGQAPSFGKEPEYIPEFAYAADIHQVANGLPSVLDKTTWTDTAVNFGKFTLSAAARAVTSAYNTVPAIANWFGADMEEADTENVLKMFDDDLSAYYSQNRESVDVVGDVIGMFVPGMAGVKGINYAQKGLAAISKGTNVGSRLARSFGTLPELGTKYATEATAAMNNAGGIFKLTDKNVVKAFAANYGQAVVEAAAFEVAASATMENSPLFENHTVKDILVNSALGGGIIGGGIIGTVTAAQTYGQLSRAAKKVGEALAPFRFAKSSEEGVDDFVKVLELRKEKFNPPIPEESITDPTLLNAARRSLEKRQRDLGVEIQNTLTKMSGGDAEVGSQLSRMMDLMDENKAWNAMLDLKQTARLGKEIKAAEGQSIKYLRLWGEGAGEVTHSKPDFFRLADTVSDSSELQREVTKYLKDQPKLGQEFSPLNYNHLAVEARYIKAFKEELTPGIKIGKEDLPYLEKALDQKITVEVDGILMDSATLRDHIKKTKSDLGDKLADQLDIDPTLNSATGAKLLNVKQSVLEGKGYSAASDEHFFAVTPADDLTQPSVIQTVYEGNGGVDGNVLTGMVKIKELQEIQQKVNEQAAAAVLGNQLEKLIKLSDDSILGATPAGAGAGLLTLASGEYGTLASKVEWLGKVTNDTIVELRKGISQVFESPAYKLLNNVEAQNELFVLRQAALSTGEKYVLSESNGIRRMILKEQDEFERRIAAGENIPEPVLPKNTPIEIPIKTDDAWEFMQTLQNQNADFLSKRGALNSAIGKSDGNWDGVVYFPQPSAKTHTHFSFVVPKNPFMEDKVQMVWAKSSDELQKLEATVGQEFRIIRKDDTENFHKMMNTYEYDRGFNSRDFATEMRRTGVAAPFIPKTNADELVTDIISHYMNKSDQLVRDAVTLHNNVAFSELRRMDSEFKSLYGSTRKGVEAQATPYESYVRTALDIPNRSNIPVWTELNNLAENAVSKVWNGFSDLLRKPKSEQEIAAINKHFDDAGFRGIKDSLTEMVANHPAEKKALSSFIQTANAFFSALILRTDPMNAVNNGVGNMVLMGSETAYLTKLIKGKGGEEAVGFLRELGEIKLPGSEAYIKSPTKLIARAYQDFIAFKFGAPEAADKFSRYQKNGWIPSMMDQIKRSADNLSITGTETTSQITSKTKQLMEGISGFLEKASGNKFAEEMNRYVSAHIADDIAQAGIKYAGLSEKEANVFINSFVNRTQGNYLASQRPLMFQGPVGQSISLFMTYQFNMMQHMFRHLSAEGGRKSAATLLGLQTSIYGMNGLPAFNFMNEYLAGGEKTGKDMYSTVMDIPGIGDWLLYGGLSNATGLGLYSRGDINPRHLTVVPTNVRDIPFISATTNFLGAMGKAASEVGAGANPFSSFLRGIEHAGVSRPLAGIAQVMNGIYRGDETVYATTTKGNVVYAQDLYSLATLGRLAGARPFDEAVTRDAYYRVQQYESKNRAQIEVLGSAIRDRINSNSEIDDATLEDFMGKYVAAGKSQKDFVKYYQKQVKDAGKNQIGKFVERGNSSMGQYMQNLTRSSESDVRDL